MVNKQRIREMLQFQDLSEEEKQRRGILGRLYGPCASITDATRNGRKYDDELWINVFTKNEIVKEMFENGGIPMELDHPIDREETDSQRIAAMLPAPPKKDKDGHLICYVDIIDTPCGRIAYQLAKYGFKLGISSRGSGDVLPDDTVDPDTYDFTTFDLVLLPAVKDARLSMVESLDKKSAAFKKAITESYDKSNSRDKEIMKETLEDLNIDIDLDEDENNEYSSNDTCGLSIDKNGFICCDLSTIRDQSNERLVEEDEKEETTDEEDEVVNTEEEVVDEKSTEEETEEESTENESNEEDAPVEEAEEEIEGTDEEVGVEEDAPLTVKDLINQLSDLDETTIVHFEPIIIDGKEYPVNNIGIDATDDDVSATLFIDYQIPEEDDNIEETEEKADDVEDEEELVLKDDSDEVKDEAEDEKAIDDGKESKDEEETEKLEEAIRTLAETIRSKNDLETKIKSLQSEKTVSDTEVKKLKEELEKYKGAFERTSIIASKVKSSESKVKALTEQLDAKQTEIAQIKRAQAAKLNESMSSSVNQIQMLTDEVKSLKKQLEEKDNQTTSQINKYRQALQEKVNTANKYKAQAEQTLKEYVNYRANMLGVRPSEIMNRLDENYSIKDINDVCDEILTDVSARPAFGIGSQPRVKITEQKQKAAANTLESGYELDDSLLELAGLK